MKKELWTRIETQNLTIQQKQNQKGNEHTELTGVRRNKGEDQSAAGGNPPTVGRTTSTMEAKHQAYTNKECEALRTTVSVIIRESQEQKQRQQQLNKVEHIMADQQITLVHIEEES